MMKALKLDPRTKLLLCLLVNVPIALFQGSSWILLFVGYALLLLLLSKEYKVALIYLGMYAFFEAFGLISSFLPKIIVTILSHLIIGVGLFLPFIAYGFLLIRTTEINDLAIALDKMKMPNSVIISFLVLFRFIPTIKEEKQAIANAMKLRGISFGFKSLATQPMKTFEYMYIPMLFSLLKSGEELTVASLTRGLGGEQKRTYLRTVKMGAVDYGVLFIFLIMMVFVFFVQL